MESRILETVNQAGNLATAHYLETFDSKGAKISVGGMRMTSKERTTKFYQTPYG